MKAVTPHPVLRAAPRLKAGFTLLELLMVMAILALLASLLLPALGKAKAKAQAIRCLNNLKQMGLAWSLYPLDHNDLVPPNIGDVNGQLTRFDLTWVSGWLTLDNPPLQLGRPGLNHPDNTNTLYLRKSLIAPYQDSLDVWRCPSDRSLSTIGGRRYPHVRTVSMNNWVGAYDVRSGRPYEEYLTPGYKMIMRISDMIVPAPSQTLVLLDEREDSINDSLFVVVMDGSPEDMGRAKLVDYPSSYHNGAGAFNFADGHSDLHQWVDARTTPPLRKDFHLPIDGWAASPGNLDIAWLQQHSTSKK